MINDASVVIGGGNWGIKEADVLGYKLINEEYYARDIDFANSTAAGTYTDSTGVIRKAPYNLAQYSEMFADAYWTSLSANVSVSSNVVSAPNGTNTADLIVAAAITSNVIYVRNSLTLPSTGIYTFSVYAKKQNQNTIGLRSLISGTLINYDLDAETSTGGFIENVGGGWFRIGFSYTAASTSESIYIYPLGTGTRTGNGVDGVYVWGAQLVEGTEALPYFPTTTRLNVPRIDYRNADGSLSTVGRLLLEPQRTNVLTYSDQFDNAIWTKGSTTVTANTDISPDGIQNADRMTIVDSTSRISQALSLGAGTYTISVYVRVISTTTAGIVRLNSTVDSVSTNFFFTPTSQWARYTTTVTAATGFTAIALRGTSPGGFVGTLAVWGFQVETGAYPTTYIPTTTAAVTRNADVASKTGVSSWIGQTQGTIFAEINVAKLLGIQSRYILVISDNTANNRIYIAFSGASSNVLRARIFTGGVLQASIDTGTISSLGTYKLAFAYNNNDAVLYVNGVQIGTDTSVTVPACSKLNVCTNQAGANPFDDGVTQSMLFLTRLTNSQLQSLTTL